MLDFSSLLAKVDKPPRLDGGSSYVDLPPYSEQEIEKVGGVVPDMAFAYDSRHHWVALLVSPGSLGVVEQQVVFPSLWPIAFGGRYPFYLMWSFTQFKQTSDYHGCNWLLPVLRQVPVSEHGATVLQWRWGLVDIQGCFVLPCQFPGMSFPEKRGLGKSIQAELALPVNRREPGCWVWVGEAEHPQGCCKGEKPPAPGDVIEVWSGQRPLPTDLTALSLSDHFALVRNKSAKTDAPVGLFNLATGQCGPFIWRFVSTTFLSICHASPAQSYETGLWTYVDENGLALLPAHFERTESVDSGLATVQLGVEHAHAQGLVLTLPDGSRQGPVGVFGPHGAKSLGRWFVAPQWRDVLGEYDGHFVVQDIVGNWGMVTPEGEAVTTFFPRNMHNDVPTDVIFQRIMHQFKRTQKRRFLQLCHEALLSGGSLGVMAGKLRSSFGRFDYGALTSADIPVRLVRDVIPQGSNAADDAQPAALPAGSPWVWHPGQRNYFASIDLRTHCAIGERSESSWNGYDDIHVPWDALVLDLPPSDPGGDRQLQQFECLKGSRHLLALNTLLDDLDLFIDQMDCESVSTFHPVLSAANRLHTWLIWLLETTTWNNVRGFEEITVWSDKTDIIDFANLPLSSESDSSAEPAAKSSPWVKPPKPQLLWSEAVHAAHLQALSSFWVWEATYTQIMTT